MRQDNVDEPALTQEDICQRVNRALETLCKRDSLLLDVDANERSITHWFACYLQHEFPEWDVDCEYNRHMDETKRLKLVSKDVKTDDTLGQTVYPDIIVHKRRTDQNLLVIEVKKSTSTVKDDNDIQKLIAFKRELGYVNTLFLKIHTGYKGNGTIEHTWI
jgi:hypothetical protein